MLLTSLESAAHTLYQFILPEETFINILPSPKNEHSSRTAAQLITSLWLNLLSFHAFFYASPRPVIKRVQQCGSAIKDIASVPLAALSVYQPEREKKLKWKKTCVQEMKGNGKGNERRRVVWDVCGTQLTVILKYKFRNISHKESEIRTKVLNPVSHSHN